MSDLEFTQYTVLLHSKEYFKYIMEINDVVRQCHFVNLRTSNYIKESSPMFFLENLKNVSYTKIDRAGKFLLFSVSISNESAENILFMLSFAQYVLRVWFTYYLYSYIISRDDRNDSNYIIMILMFRTCRFILSNSRLIVL